MYQHAGKVSILMKISNYSPVAPTKDTIFGTVDEAIRMGADAVIHGLYDAWRLPGRAVRGNRQSG